jgi:hypothetical protein
MALRHPNILHYKYVEWKILARGHTGGKEPVTVIVLGQSSFWWKGKSSGVQQNFPLKQVRTVLFIPYSIFVLKILKAGGNSRYCN